MPISKAEQWNKGRGIKKKNCPLSRFSQFHLVDIFWSNFQFGGNKLRKADEKELMEKYLIKSHTSAGGGKEWDARLPKRRIACRGSMRFLMRIMCPREPTARCTCWVVIGGASWERWPQFCSASGPPSAVCVCSNWHKASLTSQVALM